MSSTDAKIQLNFKTPGNTLINLYAADLEALDQLITDLESRAATILALEQTLGAVGSLPLAAPSQQPVSSPSPAAAPPAGGAAPAVAPAGVRVVADKWGNTWTYGLPDAPAGYALKAGKSKAGSAYSGYFDLRNGPEYTGIRPDKSQELPTIWPPR
jgi:hypothetical protein